MAPRIVTLGRFFETIDGEFALTCWQAVPLVRYVLRDAGEVLPFSAVMAQLQSCGIAPDEAFAAHGIAAQHIWQFPFLSCFGRSDGAVSVLGANVYPHALQHVFAAHPEISHFKLAVADEGSAIGRFTVYAEWADDRPDSATARQLAEVLEGKVLQALLDTSADYKAAHHDDPAMATPQVVLVPRGTGPFAEDAGRWKRSHVHKR